MLGKWLKNSLIILLMSPALAGLSQKTDTLKTFVKEEVISKLNTFSTVSLLDSNSSFSSLNELLESSSPVYVKNYGKGQLATLSIRGNGASQTQLFWNGFKMNSPTLGQSDLSLIPLFFISNATLNYSGASSTDGSGGIGGSIQLSNKLNWKKGVRGELIQEFASFNNFTSGIGFSYGGKHFFHHLKVLHQKGENNYDYVDISQPNYPLKKQENNRLSQVGVQYELGVQLNNKNLIQSTFYFFDSDRELPPIVGGTSNKETQADKNFKSFVSWKSFQSRFSSDLRLSFFQESLRYTDSISAIFSLVIVKTYQAQYRFNFSLFKKIKMEASAQSAYSEVESNGFDVSKTRNESGVYIKASQEFNKLRYDLFARQELIDDNFSPLVYGAGIVVNPFEKKLSLKGNISTNYRVPTLNDLYWNPGGNENLVPEKGWTTELGAEVKEEKIIYGLTGFYNQTDNWIQWQPTDFGYWQPVNLKSIENKGLEATVKYINSFKKSKLTTNLFYTFTSSTNKSFEEGNETLKGKQTVYVPKHKSTISVSYSYKKIGFNYSQSYNSRVFIDASNSAYLPHYFPANAGVNYVLRFNSLNLLMEFKIINIYDEQYQVTANRPIPGRNYSFNLKLNF